MKKLLLQLLFVFFGVYYRASGAPPASNPTLQEEGDHITLSNDYLRVTFDRTRHSIVVLSADFSGKRSYGGNLLAARGIVLETRDRSGHLLVAGSGNAPSSYRILEKDNRLRVLFETAGSLAAGNWNTRWTVTLGPKDRGFRLETSTALKPNANVGAACLRFYLRQWFLNGIYEKGVVQYVAGQDKLFSSTTALREFYSMDRHAGSVAIIPEASNQVLESNLLSGHGEFESGLEQVLAGGSSVHDRWLPLSGNQPLHPAGLAAAERTASYRIYPNNRAFPVHSVVDGPNMAADDLEAYYLAAYGSAAGVVGSYAIPGSAYPTLATPLRPYGETYNYFDPDAWSTVTALSFSGDPVLQKEARKILETSERSMKPDGQLPHHFNPDGPTYISLAKSSQTGPNIFWILAAIEYASGTGDEAWLKEHYPSLKRAAEWLLLHFDSRRNLLSVQGSLFIDVFIREHFTLDTNVMMVRLLRSLAPVAQYCGDAPAAQRFADFERKIKAGVNDGLWDGHDHFVTQRNADWSIRDRVDYDGNYGAVAAGVVDDPARRQAIFRRLDRGAHTHPNGRGTWVSEQRYEKADCFLGNDGDSDVAMARIWWLDMAARYRTGDLTTFQTLLHNTQSDLLANTWMGERYDGAGAFTHNAFYHEYPEILSMVLREMRYGIDVKIDSVTIRPFGLDHYDFKVGELSVHYAQREVRVRVPGTSPRTYRIYGLAPNARYRMSTGKTLLTDRDGMAVFRAHAGVNIAIERVAIR